MALLVVVLALAAQDPAAIDPLRDVDVRGTRTFAALDVRDALARDSEACSAMLGSDHEGVAAVLARRVAEGYRRAGFLDVAVQASIAGEKVVLEVEEGGRCRCGPIRVSGARHVAAEALVAALTSAQEDGYAGWREGEPARGDAITRLAAWRCVAGAYEAAGRLGMRGEAQIVRDADRAELHVAIADEGQPVRIGMPVLMGERPEDREAVLAGMPLRADDVYTAAARQRLCAYLDSLGRYVRYRVPALADAAAGRIEPFVVRCEPASYAPAMAASAAEIALVRRGIAWLQRELERGVPVRASFAVPAGRLFGLLLRAQVAVELGAHGIAADCEVTPAGDERPLQLEALVSANEVLLADGQERFFGARFPAFVPRLAVATRPDGDSAMVANWGYSVGRTGSGGVLLQLHPLTAAYLVHRFAAHREMARDGEHLVFRTPDSTAALRIAPDGSTTLDVRTGVFRITVGGDPLPARLAAARARCAGKPPCSLPSLLAHWLAHAAGPSAPVRALLASAASYAPSSGAAFPDLPAEDDEPFRIPAEEAGWDAASARWLAYRLAARFGDAWPAKLLRALPELFDRQRSSTAAERVLALAKDGESMGPIGCVLVAAVFDWLAARETAKQVWQLARARWRFEDAYLDVLDLAPEGTWARAWLLGLGEHWRADPAVAALLPPEEVASNAAALRAGLHLLWDSGVGEGVRDMLDERSGR